MKNIYVNKEEFDKLNYYHLRIGTVHTESTLYFTSDNKDIIKFYTYYNKEYLSNKEVITQYLNDFDKQNHIDGFVVPKGKFYLNDTFRGIILPKINGINASYYLNKNDCPLTIKIEILRQIGKMLEEIKNKGKELNLAYSDVHADNFIVDMKDNIKVYGIDTDSVHILDTDYGINDFLYSNHWLKYFDKYRFDNFGMVLTDYETDIYCYIMMI